MDAQPIGGKGDTIDAGGETAGVDTRMLQARLDMMVATLSIRVDQPVSDTPLDAAFPWLFPMLGTVKWSAIRHHHGDAIRHRLGTRIIRQGYARDSSDSDDCG